MSSQENIQEVSSGAIQTAVDPIIHFDFVPPENRNVDLRIILGEMAVELEDVPSETLLYSGEGAVLCDPARFSARIKREEGDAQERINRLKRLTQWRPLAPVRTEVFAELDRLAGEQPNLVAAIDRIRASLHARFVAGGAVKLPPILLYGPPGTGKTRLVKRIAKALGVPVQEIPLSGSNDPTKVTGLSRTWKNAGPSVIIQTLADGDCVNPLFVFDELDKCGQGRDDYGNPLDRLLLLAEEETACEFLDDFLEIPVNASYASIIATANSLDPVPAPLLSRFESIYVPPLDAIGRRKMVMTIYEELRQTESYGRLLENSLDPKVADTPPASE